MTAVGNKINIEVASSFPIKDNKIMKTIDGVEIDGNSTIYVVNSEKGYYYIQEYNKIPSFNGAFYSDKKLAYQAAIDATKNYIIDLESHIDVMRLTIANLIEKENEI